MLIVVVYLGSLVYMPDFSDSTLGFVGIGTMNSAIVRGLCTLDKPPSAIVMSPRNAVKAAALHAEFPAITSIAENGQEVLDRSDIIFIGVLPKQCEDVLRALRFEARHTVVSLVSTTPMASLKELCAPAGSVLRAIPLPPVAKHVGATVMCPPHPVVTPLFESLGTTVAVEEEEVLKKLMPVTCLMGQFYAQQQATQEWLEAQGVDAASAAKWTGAVFHTMSYDSAEAGSSTFKHLIDEQVRRAIALQRTSAIDHRRLFYALRRRVA